MRFACRAKALLYTGDSLALLTFAAIGQLSHKHDVSLFATLGTAAPFLLGELLPADYPSTVNVPELPQQWLCRKEFTTLLVSQYAR